MDNNIIGDIEIIEDGSDNKKKKKIIIIIIVSIILVALGIFILSTFATKSVIDDSKKTSIKNDILAYLREFDKAFSDRLSNVDSGSDLSDRKTHIININGIEYEYLCMTIKDLIDEGYIKNSKDISGYFQAFFPNNSTELTKYVNIKYEGYYIQDLETNINSDKFSPSDKPTNKDIEKPESNINCPSSVTIIPN